MRKIGINKQYPNPPWPSEQPVVVVPPGSNPTSVGVPNVPLRQMQGFEQSEMDSVNSSMLQENEPQYPIMGNMYGQMNQFPGSLQTPTGCALNSNVTEYLCGQIGQYVRIEFMFGDNMHVEKVGIMRQVGRNYIVISETGTNNMTVCSTSNVKFINIYSTNGNMPRN